MSERYDAVLIGGGFYGCAIALFLAERFPRVVVIERNDDLLQRASYVNQARVHTGYHYPRSLQTAASSANNLQLFRELYEDCVDTSFTALYAIARSGSKVNGRYFTRFCRQLGLPLKPAHKKFAHLFSPKLIEEVYECEEYAFNADALKQMMRRRLDKAGVEVRTGTVVENISRGAGGESIIQISGNAGGEEIRAAWAYNTTYANLNRIGGLDPARKVGLRHQVTEVCLITPPEELRAAGVTVMDGPFFSTMPFPARGLHSLTHVRYTPHFTWHERDNPELSPDETLAENAKKSRYEWMLRDSCRYLPVLAKSKPQGSLFEIKTTLVDTEIDDARPIAFHRDSKNPRLISVLGGKIDNIFDVLKVIDATLKLEAA